MYIQDRDVSDAQTLPKDQSIISRPALYNSYHPDGAKEVLLGNSIYVWANEGLGQSMVFTLPKATPAIPDDRTLLTELQTINTKEARALGQAFLSLGKPQQFKEALLTALESLPSQDKLVKYEIYLARLGAEAFILDIDIPSAIAPLKSFVAHTKHLYELTSTNQARYLHFSMRRLLAISLLPSTPDIDRRQMDRANTLFRVFQAELATSGYRSISSESLLLGYRTLLVQIIWKHYQNLLDRGLAAAAKSRLQWGIFDKAWDKDLKTAAITAQVGDERALVPTFRLTPKVYRDHFKPAAATDLEYTHYTSKPRPAASPEMTFRAVFRRRVEQMEFIKHLRQEWATDPLPQLHNSASWQVWVRKTWDKPLLRKENKLDVILNYVSWYFRAFTAHAPHNIREGCGEKNYLTRAFPRAVTGSLVHDCFVYAFRWLHILGRLFTPGSTPNDIAKPCIFLIFMPAHVGVMIRAKTLILGKMTEIVISINNKHAEVYVIDSQEKDEIAAHKVVQDMYQGMMTPFVIRRLKAKPTDAKALWNEACKFNPALPYKDPSEPHLRYLAHNAAIARISRGVSDAARDLWQALQQNLKPAKDQSGKVPTARVIAEIRQYGASIEKLVKAASDKHAKDVKPLIVQINDDLRANQKRRAKNVLVVETTPYLPWAKAIKAFRLELKLAIQSGNLSGIHPDKFFPEDDFAAAVDL